jgi:hypothetical protein
MDYVIFWNKGCAGRAEPCPAAKVNNNHLTRSLLTILASLRKFSRVTDNRDTCSVDRYIYSRDPVHSTRKIQLRRHRLSGGYTLRRHHNEESCSIGVRSLSPATRIDMLILFVGRMSQKGIRMPRSKYERPQVMMHGVQREPTWPRSPR